MLQNLFDQLLDLQNAQNLLEMIFIYQRVFPQNSKSIGPPKKKIQAGQDELKTSKTGLDLQEQPARSKGDLDHLQTFKNHQTWQRYPQILTKVPEKFQLDWTSNDEDTSEGSSIICCRIEGCRPAVTIVFLIFLVFNGFLARILMPNHESSSNIMDATIKTILQPFWTLDHQNLIILSQISH